MRAEYILPPDLWQAEVDENQLEQVISNLTINAVQAMPGGGILKIAARNETIRPDDSRELEEGQYISIEVADQGTGIPLEHLEKIFDHYFTTKEKGSGLGLAISYSMAKKHGGTIIAESMPGKGSTFTIFLPATTAREAAPPAASHEELPSGGGRRVLVMDDEETVLTLAADILRALGYQAETARDGSEAVARYRDALAAGRPFAAVITDLTVPGGMGGKETARTLLRIDPEARIIVSSGYANDSIMSDYGEHCFRGVIPKPYHIGEIARKLHEVISG